MSPPFLLTILSVKSYFCHRMCFPLKLLLLLLITPQLASWTDRDVNWRKTPQAELVGVQLTSRVHRCAMRCYKPGQLKPSHSWVMLESAMLLDTTGTGTGAVGI